MSQDQNYSFFVKSSNAYDVWEKYWNLVMFGTFKSVHFHIEEWTDVTAEFFDKAIVSCSMKFADDGSPKVAESNLIFIPVEVLETQCVGYSFSTYDKREIGSDVAFFMESLEQPRASIAALTQKAAKLHRRRATIGFLMGLVLVVMIVTVVLVVL